MTGDVLKQETLKVTVYDKNKITADECIGSGTVSLRRAGTRLDKDTLLHIRLTDKHGMPVGTAAITALITAHTHVRTEEGDQLLPDGKKLPKFGFLEFSEISATGLRNSGT